MTRAGSRSTEITPRSDSNVNIFSSQTVPIDLALAIRLPKLQLQIQPTVFLTVLPG